MFLTTDPDAIDPPEIDASVFLYNIDELRSYVIRTINNYYSLPDIDNGQLDIIEPLKDSDGNFLPIEMYFFTVGKEYSYSETIE